MKEHTRMVKIVIGTVVILVASLASVMAAVSLPYSDTFSVPPYTNNTTIVGQQGWWNLGGGTPALAVITNDFTGSGRGTSLFVANSSGPAWGDVAQTVTGITNGDWLVRIDFYGAVPSTWNVTPILEFVDEVGFSHVASLGSVRSANEFRLNSAVIPGITAQTSTWYTAEFLFHLASRTLDIQVTDGVSTGQLDSVAFLHPSANHIDWIRFIPAGASDVAASSGLIDNLQVSQFVPEPSVAMLLLAGVGMWRWKRTAKH